MMFKNLVALPFLVALAVSTWGDAAICVLFIKPAADAHGVIGASIFAIIYGVSILTLWELPVWAVAFFSMRFLFGPERERFGQAIIVALGASVIMLRDPTLNLLGALDQATLICTLAVTIGIPIAGLMHEWPNRTFSY
jgi:hypothetical protein